ncbi:MAG: pantetheine-phosphate adenylyltransferase [Bacteroidales bacterium]|nr:pantetheine-phosphate adenylyltransferase [Bacteroidales bacterium]
MKKAVFAGSFDPITIGHEDVVRRALPLFDRIVVAVGCNSSKRCMYDVEQRMEWIRATFEDCPQVDVLSYEGLTTDFCRQIGAGYLLRGVRNMMDMAYEQQIADLNLRLAPDIETVFLLTRKEYSDVSSSAVRELLRYGKPVGLMLPSKISIK